MIGSKADGEPRQPSTLHRRGREITTRPPNMSYQQPTLGPLDASVPVTGTAPLLPGACSNMTSDGRSEPSNLPWEQIDKTALSIRASRRLSAVPRPFLKWAGSKRTLLPHLLQVLPNEFRTYREPFAGAAALFFLLRPANATLSDTCGDVINTFTAVRDNVAAVLRYLKPLVPDQTVYYELRQRRRRGRFAEAARFIYLNKTCWNGLYRVNSSGEFNVPYGLPKSVNLVDPANLRACAAALSSPTIKIALSDFEDALVDVDAGDLVYLDPPYVTGHNNNGFIEYNRNLFSWADQVRLAAVASTLSRRGAYVVISNAAHRDVVDLYKGFSYQPFMRWSTLASDPTKRRPVQEGLLVSSSLEHLLGRSRGRS